MEEIYLNREEKESERQDKETLLPFYSNQSE